MQLSLKKIRRNLASCAAAVALPAMLAGVAPLAAGAHTSATSVVPSDAAVQRIADNDDQKQHPGRPRAWGPDDKDGQNRHPGRPRAWGPDKDDRGTVAHHYPGRPRAWGPDDHDGQGKPVVHHYPGRPRAWGPDDNDGQNRHPGRPRAWPTDKH